MANKSKNQIEIDSRRKIYEQIAIKSRRDICLNSRLDKVATSKGISKNAYIIMHLENALLKDGYPKPETPTQADASLND